MEDLPDPGVNRVTESCTPIDVVLVGSVGIVSK
jgi:hypothetical protein